MRNTDQLRKLKAFESKSLYLFSIGTSFYLVSSLLIFRFNRNFSGALSDSSFYFRMFEYIGKSGIIPLEKYEVASSPIYVHLMGIFWIPSINQMQLIFHLIYVLMALVSIYFFARILNNYEFRIAVCLMLLFASSGYFVAPSLNPTSDAPAILFSILTIYFLQTGRSLQFAIFSALLVSTRQNLVWIIFGIFVWEVVNEKKRFKAISQLLPKYLLAFISLMVTFVYCGYRLTIPNYEISSYQNNFSIPNFLSLAQIFLALFAIIISLIPLRFPLELSKSKISRNLILVILLSLLPICFLFRSNQNLIGEGLGWLSLLSYTMNLPMFVILTLSSIAFNVSIIFLYKSDLNVRNLSFILLAFLVGTSTLMPIPFLRYFEIYLILIVSVAAAPWEANRKIIPNVNWILAVISISGINFLKILS